MAYYDKIGAFRGRKLFQKRGQVGGYRNVFVKLQGVKNELVYPTFGGVIKNPFKGDAKLFAGDLCWYKTNDYGVRPEIYILKTFEVVSASGTTVNIDKGDNYRHIPCVGDILMVAPAVIGGTGTGVTVTSVTETTTTVDSVEKKVWAITTSADISASATAGTILVEAEEAGSDKKMLVQAVNSVVDCDCDFFGNPKIASGTNLIDDEDLDEFDAERFLYAPALGGLMYTKKMSPMPQCILDLNKCNVNGWFKVDFMNLTAAKTADQEARIETLEG